MILALLQAMPTTLPGASTTEAWPQFRGPGGTGVAVQATPPIRISPTNRVLWKIEVPWSPSSPCVWGEKIFLTTFADGQLETRCYECNHGQLSWTRHFKPEKLETFHQTEGSPAAATPATDGRHVVSYFGSFGLVCHSPEGKELWCYRLPVAMSGGGFGSGTSPVIAGKLVLLNRDQDQDSSLLALNVETGKKVWETSRPDSGGSFSTPLIWNNAGVDEAVLAGGVRLKGYRLKNGQEDWMVEGITTFVCTSPAATRGLLIFAGWAPGKADSPWPTWEGYLERYHRAKEGEIIVADFPGSEGDFLRGLDLDHDGKVTKADWDRLMERNAKGENVALAVQAGGHGNITRSHVAWKFNKGLPYVASPLVYDGRLYLVRDGGMVSCFDVKTGRPYYLQERLEAIGSYYASPVAAEGRIYFASSPGKLSVIKAGGDKPEIVHQADFGERIFATPALVGNKLYLRTQKHLYVFAS